MLYSEQLRVALSGWWLGVLVVLVGIPPEAHAQKPLSAAEADIEITYTLNSGTRTVLGRYYRSKDGRVREDTPVASTITDQRRGTITLLNHSLKEAQVIAVPA